MTQFIRNRPVAERALGKLRLTRGAAGHCSSRGDSHAQGLCGIRRNAADRGRFGLSRPCHSQNGIPVAPEMPIPPMPVKPVEYPTAEGMKIKVSVVTRGIEHPWSIAFVSNDVWARDADAWRLACGAQRGARSRARQRRTRSEARSPLGAARGDAAPEVCREQVRLPHVSQAAAGRQRRTRTRARPLGRQAARRYARSLRHSAGLRHDLRGWCLAATGKLYMSTGRRRRAGPEHGWPAKSCA